MLKLLPTVMLPSYLEILEVSGNLTTLKELRKTSVSAFCTVLAVVFYYFTVTLHG